VPPLTFSALTALGPPVIEICSMMLIVGSIPVTQVLVTAVGHYHSIGHTPREGKVLAVPCNRWMCFLMRCQFVCIYLVQAASSSFVF
jgi:hypothetical protein